MTTSSNNTEPPPPFEAWGSQNRYYTADSSADAAHAAMPTSGTDEAKAIERLRTILQRLDPDLDTQIQSWVKKWNQVIRESLRTHTGLRLSVGDDRTAVPIKVGWGLPKSLAKIIGGLDEDALRLLIRAPLLKQTREGLRFLTSESEIVRPTGSLGFLLQERETIRASAALVERAYQQLELTKLTKALTESSEDVLGAYFFKVPEIHLYWMAIGLIASMLDVDPEALTVVTLAHELAHAYTHLGRDIDGQRWETKAFGATDLHIVEGLAQKYTELVCKDMEGRHGRVPAAFKTLLNGQSPPYTDFSKWVPGNAGSSGEVVRTAMIICRENEIVDYTMFKEAVGKAQRSINRRAKKTGDFLE